MAYVTDSQDPDQQNTAVVGQQPVQVGTSTSSGDATPAGVKTATAAPTSGVISNGAPTPGTNAQPSTQSGQFQQLGSYLSENQQGATNVGTRIAGNINASTSAAQAGVKGAADDFTGQVNSNTNAYNGDLINKAAADPTSYVNNADVLKQTSGTYGGPVAWGGSADENTAISAIDKGQQNAQLGTTEGGRGELIGNTAVKPMTTGGTNFDQYLVNNTQPAIGAVNNAVAGAGSLGTLDATTGTGLNSAIAAAQQTNTNTANQAKGVFTGALADQQTGLQGQLTAKQQQDAAQDAALKAFLTGNGQPAGTPTQQAAPGMMTSGNVTRDTVGGDGLPASSPALLASIGMTQDEYSKLQSLNAQLIAAGKPGIDLSTYLKGSNDSALGLGNVATAADDAKAQALNSLAGTPYTPFTSGTATGPSFDYGSALTQIMQQMGLPTGTGSTAPLGPTGGVGGAGGTGVGAGGGANESPGGSGAASAGDSVGQDANAVSTTPASTANTAFSVAAAIANPTPMSIAVAISNVFSTINEAMALNAAAATVAAAPSTVDTTAFNAMDAAPDTDDSSDANDSSTSPDGTSTTGVAADSSNASATAADAADAAAAASADASDSGTSSSSSADNGDSGTSGTSGDSGDGGGGGGGGGGKIICTAMNDAYGLPYEENKVWIKYAKTHLKPEHQKGYHKVFLPLVKYGYKSGNGPTHKFVRNTLEYIAVHRTADIKAELAGTYRRPVHKMLRKAIEPALAFIGSRIKD